MGVESRSRVLPILIATWGLLLGGRAAAQEAPEPPPPPPAEPMDRMTALPKSEGIELTWSDAEERLQGILTPGVPKAGGELNVMLNVGSFEGKPFEGPLVVGLRRPDAVPVETHPVTRGAVNWRTTFHLNSPGPHTLTVGFRTTRYKHVQVEFDVADSGISAPYVVALGGLFLALALVLGVQQLIQSRKPPPPPSLE